VRVHRMANGARDRQALTIIAWHRRGSGCGGQPTPHGATDRGRGGPHAHSHDGAGEPALGAPRIHAELLKLGVDVTQATVAKYMGRRRQPPWQIWRTFLRNHIGQIVAADFFVVRPRPTVCCSSSCSSPMIGDASGTSRSPRIQRRRGRPNSFVRLSVGRPVCGPRRHQRGDPLRVGPSPAPRC